ncbi:unnamed protein product [Owenia fusiformis]|uniref:Ig-like domain-containing protein n=1 Tax=Owenia fusiformis TaxID=6347 RepID=A0A8S4NI22_OWEFU|nr:unnamed protein product [Owenia fusiformis]
MPVSDSTEISSTMPESDSTEVFSTTPVSDLTEISSTLPVSDTTEISSTMPDSDSTEISSTTQVSDSTEISSTMPTTSPDGNEIPTIDGGWSYWKPWSDCSTTCGGGVRSRVRTCTGPEPSGEGLICSGSSRQTEACSNWECPDCNRPCPDGGILVNCSTCTCTNSVLYGRVTTKRNLPLENVGVFLRYKQWEALTLTDMLGRFHIKGICVPSEQIIFKKNLHSEARITAQPENATHATASAQLQRLEMPFIKYQPSNRHRFLGQDVSFCCETEGTPNVHTLEWYKNNRIIKRTEGSYFPVLTLDNLSVNDSGLYACRAVSAGGNVMSRPAQLNVHEESSQDSCKSEPAVRYTTLPTGCTYSGPDTASEITTVNLGECELNTPCLTQNDQISRESCNDTSTLCCGAIRTRLLDITCDTGNTFTMVQIEECGCIECLRNPDAEGSTKIDGRAFGTDVNGDMSPLILGAILYKGEQIGSTSATGIFTVTVPVGIDRFTLIFQDTHFKTFADAVVVMDYVRGQTATQNVRMKRLPKPVTFNAEDGFELELGSSDITDKAGFLKLPQRAVVDENGNPFYGSVNATVEFMDPRQIDDMRSSPVDFSASDENGEETILETFGMVRVSLSDGESGKPLQSAGNMQIGIDVTTMGIQNQTDGIFLWGLDDVSGQWVKTGDMVYKTAIQLGLFKNRKMNRDFVVGDFNSGTVRDLETTRTRRETYWVNVDRPGGPTRIERIIRETLTDLCYVNIRIYNDANFNPGSGLGGASVNVLTRQPDGVSYSGYKSATSPNSGSTCLQTLCSRQADIIVERGRDNLFVHPDQGNFLPPMYRFRDSQNRRVVNFDVVKMDSQLGRNGPVYIWQKQRTCLNSKENDFNFRFAPISPPSVLNPRVKENGRRLSWYQREGDQNRVCYIKIRVQINSASAVSFNAVSRWENSAGDEFGNYVSYPMHNPETGDLTDRGVCLQYKCPGSILAIADRPPQIYRDISTHVTTMIAPATSCRATVNPNMVPFIRVTQFGFTWTAAFDESSGNGIADGIYSDRGEDATVLRFCKTGSKSITDDIMIPDTGAAVEFNCM